MEALKRLRIYCVRLSILATIVLTVLVWALWGRTIGLGLAMGGLGGTLAFWLLALRAEKLATLPPDKVQSWALQYTFFRLLIYALVLYRAYSLDPEFMHGLFAAAGGLFIVRLAIIFLAFTGLDLKDEQAAPK